MSFANALHGPQDDLGRFDAAGGPDDALAGFDAASGQTHVPAGRYACAVARGELTTTKAGKAAYRLALDVSDGPHAGFRLWRYFTFDTPAAANRAKAALAPLGLRTSADLRAPFPRFGTAVRVSVLVGVQTRPDGTPGNDVERVDLVRVEDALPNPHAVDPVALASGEGGTP